jgi:hypothetical protein
MGGRTVRFHGPHASPAAAQLAGHGHASGSGGRGRPSAYLGICSKGTLRIGYWRQSR